MSNSCIYKQIKCQNGHFYIPYWNRNHNISDLLPNLEIWLPQLKLSLSHIRIFESPNYDVNPQLNTQGTWIGPLVSRTSRYRHCVMHVLAFILSITWHFFFICHTCEPSDGRINSPVFLGHLPISNILPNPPDFYMFFPYSPDFYMFTSQMCNLHHMHLGQGFERHTFLYTVQKSFILTSKFVLTTLCTHPGLIISHLVDDYLNIEYIKNVNGHLFVHDF